LEDISLFFVVPDYLWVLVEQSANLLAQFGIADITFSGVGSHFQMLTPMMDDESFRSVAVQFEQSLMEHVHKGLIAAADMRQDELPATFPRLDDLTDSTPSLDAEVSDGVPFTP
jgi:hypothetical protein